MGKYKNVKSRLFFGLFDKYRFDTQKNLCKDYDASTFNPYTLYGYDECIRHSYFQIHNCDHTENETINNMKKIANWDFRLFSNGANIPMKYKTVCVIALHVDKVYKDTSFFDSIVLIEKTKFIHFTDTDDVGLFIYLLWKSGKYTHMFDKTKIYMFYQGNEPKYRDCPNAWDLIKYIPEIKSK